MTWQTKIMDIEYEASLKGREEGWKEGWKKGWKKGWKEGWKEGWEESREKTLRILIKAFHDFSYNPEDAEHYLTEDLHISQEEARNKVACYWPCFQNRIASNHSSIESCMLRDQGNSE